MACRTSSTSQENGIKCALDYIKKQYPVFMWYLLNDYSLYEYDYSQSTIEDREDLYMILRAIGNSLDGVKSVHEEWEPVRKDTIHLFNLYGDQLDFYRRKNNYCRIASSAAGIVSSSCSIAGMAFAMQTGGASMFLGVAGGSIKLVSQNMFSSADMQIRSKAQEQAMKDELLTRILDEKVNELTLGIGRLGTWHSRANMIPINCATIRDVAETGKSVAMTGFRVLLSGMQEAVEESGTIIQNVLQEAGEESGTIAQNIIKEGGGESGTIVQNVIKEGGGESGTIVQNIIKEGGGESGTIVQNIIKEGGGESGTIVQNVIKEGGGESGTIVQNVIKEGGGESGTIVQNIIKEGGGESGTIVQNIIKEGGGESGTIVQNVIKEGGGESGTIVQNVIKEGGGESGTIVQNVIKEGGGESGTIVQNVIQKPVVKNEAIAESCTKASDALQKPGMESGATAPDPTEGTVTPSESNIIRNSMIGLHVFFIILDIVAIGKAIDDIRKGSKTATGEHFRRCAMKLEAERKKMKAIYDKIKHEGEVRDLMREGYRKDETIACQGREIAKKDDEIEELRKQLADMKKEQ